jgi:signal transduction histidine kinase
MVEPTPVQAGSVPERAPTVRGTWRWPRSDDLLPLGYYLAVAVVLAAVGYPSWRILALALTAVVPQAASSFFGCAPGARRHDPKRCVNAELDQVAWWIVVSQASLLGTTALTTAFTGGIGSPLLVTLIASYAAATSVVGDRLQTRVLLGATGLVVLALAALPSDWTGPALSRSAYTALLLSSVLGVGALLAPVHAIVRRKGEEMIRARQELASDALARGQALEQVGTKVAHELKNPLTGVKALVQLGLRNPAEASSHERLGVVEREVSRMQEILQNYLSFTRPLQAVTPARVHLGTLVSDALVVLSARADEARVRLYAQGDATIEADPRRVTEALLNLVANAIEATPPGGAVEVEVRRARDDAELVIRDTGRGMPAEVLGRIGTPFFTTRDAGTGLGVVLARAVVAQHGGSMRYESEPGKGTSVTVTLPLVATGGRDAARAAGG